MKHIKLIAVLFYLLMLSVAGGKFFLCAQALALRTDYNCKDKDILASGKLTLPYLNLNGAVEWNNKLKYNWGAAFHTETFFPLFPVIFKAGNLTAGGSISRLNSPELSGTLSSTVRQINPSLLECSLPSYNSFSRPLGWFLQGGYSSKTGIVRNTSLSFFMDDSLFTLSYNLKNVFNKKLTVQACFTGGLYPYKNSDQSSWFTTQPFYHAGSHTCFGCQLGLSEKKWGFGLITNFYESPDGHFKPVFRLESFVKFEDFSFNAFGFYNPWENLITSSGKTLTPLLQFRTIMQYQFLSCIKSPLIIKSAFCTQADINLNSQAHVLKALACIKCTGQITSVNLNTAVSFNLKNVNEGTNIDFTGANTEVKFGTYFKALKPELSAKFSFKPDDKKEKWTFSQKAGINLYYYGKVEFSNKNSIVFTQKKNYKNTAEELKKDISFTSSLGTKIVIKDLSFKLNVAVEL